MIIKPAQDLNVLTPSNGPIGPSDVITTLSNQPSDFT